MLCYGGENMNRGYPNQQFLPSYAGYYGEYGGYPAPEATSHPIPPSSGESGISNPTGTSPLASPDTVVPPGTLNSDSISSTQLLSSSLANQVGSHLHDPMASLHSHISTVPTSLAWADSMQTLPHG